MANLLHKGHGIGAIHDTRASKRKSTGHYLIKGGLIP